MANSDSRFGARIRQLLSHADYRWQFAVFLAGVALGVFLIFYVWAQHWAYRRTGQGLGIGVFPTIFLAALIVFSILCLFDTYRRGKSAIEKEGAEAETETSDLELKWWPVVVLAVAAFAATYAIPRVDPVVLVAALGTFILAFGGIRRWYLLVGTAVGLGLFVYVFFLLLADVFFPTVWLP